MTESEFLKTMGGKIREARNKKGFSLMDVQREGITNISNMSRIETGRVNPHLLTLKKLSEMFDIDIKKLI
jgi:transcriptional regulator with XRE-family HTH domain